MTIDSERLLVSLSPDYLELASRFDVNIELKFDWEHNDILSGEKPLSGVLEAAGVEPSRVRSVHLPPGTKHRHGMAVTQENRGKIIDFVHAQMDAIPEAYLTAHPPKKFDYREQMRLLAELTSLTDREISIENLPDECQWHSIPAMAYYAYLSRETSRLDEFWLTVDSAHLPERPRCQGDILSLSDSWADELAESLGEQDASLPDGFVEDCERLVERRVEEYIPEEVLSEDRTSRWAPFAQTVLLTADRIKSIHLNDPKTDGVPVTEPHNSESLFDCALDGALDNETYIVLEPSDVEPEELPELVEKLKSRLR